MADLRNIKIKTRHNSILVIYSLYHVTRYIMNTERTNKNILYVSQGTL